ncbi:acetyl-CoA synthetase-like protein [Clavulina sp. PMI_390]|nr:acetyl-CoA synthetase-like protein [Clavulina sp. PMI_390]
MVNHLPPYPKVLPGWYTRQGATSKTFVTPPVDGTVTAPELWDFLATNAPTHPYFIYEDNDTHELVTIDWKQVRLATHRTAEIVKSYNVPTDGTKVIGILALADTVSTFILIHAIMRAGYVPFPLSPRNSPSAIAHLLKQAKVTHLFVSEDPSMQGLSKGSLKVLLGQGGQEVERLPMPFYFDVAGPAAPGEEESIVPVAHAELDSPGLILHSSGSTSFPKPIHITQRMLVEWMRIQYYGEVDLAHAVIGGVALPMFHALGVIVSLSMVRGAVLGVFHPVRQPAFPTPDRVIHAVTALKMEILFAIPVFLEAWSHNPAYVEALKPCRAVVFSGGPLSKVVGDALAAEGIHLMQVLGITEVGCANVYIPSYVEPTLWEYFKFGDQFHVVMEPQADTDAVELRVLPCATHTPAVINCKIDGKDGYATNDLMMEHPTKKGYYKVFGRADDQIMLSTGEKTNPGPIEAIIAKDPLVDGAVLFGRGKTQNGVIVQPAARLGLDVSDPTKVGHYLDSIWPSVKLANDYAPAHSRLFREVNLTQWYILQMVILAKPTKPFTFTGKGSIRKRAVVEEYTEEIDAAYAALEAGTSTDVEAPATWDKESTLDYVRKVVHKVMEAKVEDGDDIFQHGSDSLQSTVIRNSIVNKLTASGYATTTIGANFIYENPSVAQLAVATYAIIDPSSYSAADKVAAKVAELEALVAKYSADFPVHTPTASAPTSEVIVMTGSTGALGTTMLAQLVNNPSVSKIYALNRKGAGKTLKQRQVASLIDRGYDATVVSSSKVVLVETDAKNGPLGLTPAVYDEIRSSATSILHTAWRVDFNLSLSTFEPLFGGLRELVDLALKSPLPTPPRLLFASSLSIFGNWHSKTPAAETPIADATIAVGSGYGESKWVAERVLANAAEKTPLRPVIARIGQLSGGKNGSWNTAEWIPAIVRSGEVVGGLPASDDDISWLPLQTAASAIIDFRKAETGTVHLAHPYPVAWNAVFGPIAQALNVPLIPYNDWLARLEADLKNPAHTEVEAATANPVLRLIDMFRAGFDTTEAREAMGVPKLQTTQAVKASPALARGTLAPLGKNDALGWLHYWQSKGLLQTKQFGEVKETTPSATSSGEPSTSWASSVGSSLVIAAGAVVGASFLLSLLE